MAIKPDYAVGTVSLAAGGTVVTGVGTLWLAAKILPGATFKVKNLDAIILSVDSNTQITLKEPWTGGALPAGSSYAIRFQPDGSSLAAATRDLLEKLGNGNVEALADLNLDYNKIPIGTGPGAFTLIDRSELTQGVDVDAKVATMAERALYDGQAEGFTVMVAHAADPNVLANPGFELGATGWTLTTGITIDSTVSHSGANCAKLDKGSVGAGGTARNLVTASKYPVSPGETYLVSGWVRCNSGQSSSGGAYFAIYWYDATDTLISGVNAVSNQPFTPTWTKLSGSALAPANAATATVRAINNTPSTAQNLFVDDVSFQLRDGSRSAVYFKLSAVPGDWSEASYLTGPLGPVPDITVGTTTTRAPGLPAVVTITGTDTAPVVNFEIPAGEGFLARGAHNNGTNYAKGDVVTYNGSSFIAKIANINQLPPTLPTESNTWWQLLAKKGTDGAGTGNVVGPATSVDGRVALFDGVTGKLLKDSGGAAVDYATGYFFPSISFSTPGDLSVSYARALGRYTRIGNTVHFQIDLFFTPTYTTASGNFIIDGMPFTAGSTAQTPGAPQSVSPGMAITVAQVSNINFATGQIQMFARVNDQLDTITITFGQDNAGSQNAAVANFPSGIAKGICLGGMYFLP